MIYEVFMPALSSTMTEGKIVSWTKAPGDKVEKGETVVIVESDKADMDVEAFYEGYLASIVVPAGAVAPVGMTIAYLAETIAEIATAQQQAQATTTPIAPPPPPPPAAAVASGNGTPQVPATPLRSGRPIISPRARKLAKELGVDLGTLTGSGPHGRIVAADVEAVSGEKTAMAIAPSVAAVAKAPTPIVAKTTPGILVPFTTLQAAVVRNMVASLEVPTFHVGYTITTDPLDQLYKQIKSKGVTMTVLLAKAVALTLQKHPLLSASYTPQGIQHSRAINIAVAVAMEDGGLITPVLQQADQVDIYALARNWKDLVARSRTKQLQPDEYNSGTFTLSNLGMFGVDRFDAILPPGQGAILAIGASRPQVVATKDGLMGVRSQMQVNLTCDHRVIYGADAAAFLQDLAKLIETNPPSLTL
ncbi:branched-chain alpha-keto acid dehydrogenase subunit E2 [Neosynechococcus sphagnicola sy1]|uniref:Dihydrolipoamide acetyltransferase component of pyruvate dehydrogenase complex n=1 Tax=Neosynechococcus sphagnicola sy1 TaxID=1497020 RepID=A0A098TPE4_9CYAN|nr:dihydrolipoamide acetyltransferase family protein [Neosynechococcus sphagnicola]KGF73762.1 branched-chain alpha-keto acid dehydrogenase subunit E2 [Neosynechococcus sphagnicola sy1]